MHQRIERLRKRLAELGLDALLVSSLTNIRYLFGFTGSNAIAVVAPDRCYFVTDKRYIQQSGDEVRDAEILITEKDCYDALRNVPIFSSGFRLGIEVLNLTVKNFYSLKKLFPSVKLIASERVVEGVSAIKEPREVESIRAAGAICTQVVAEIKSLIKPGVNELDISAEVSYRTMRLGSEKDPFEPIVASGKRSALPHGISSSKKIEQGDLVITDFGATVNGYAADFTRTFVVGEIDTEQKAMADAVLAALQMAELSAKPGMSGRQLDQIARDFLSDNGYGEYFQHSLGHGLGLDVHEIPRIGQRSRDPLQAGNVFTLEPGIYIPQCGGVRIEDDFLLTQTGVDNLTPAPRGLESVG